MKKTILFNLLIIFFSANSSILAISTPFNDTFVLRMHAKALKIEKDSNNTEGPPPQKIGYHRTQFPIEIDFEKLLPVLNTGIVGLKTEILVCFNLPPTLLHFLTGFNPTHKQFILPLRVCGFYNNIRNNAFERN